ncbi:MAG: thioredoxin-dependent thiol peroxidase [Magnetococcales bacterium]|nr:thioredoxin-dependent thiol peroxidase [Magnetococcales bacterium]
MLLKENAVAPNLTLPDQNEQLHELASLYGPNGSVVYFYPKDNTPGCTLEAKDFQALSPEFEKLGIHVIGLSKDSTASHAKFANKHNLSFTLLSDSEGKACEGFGVWQEKKNYGKVYMGIVRSTFLIDAKGVVLKTWTKVKTKEHAQKVLEEARNRVSGEG